LRIAIYEGFIAQKTPPKVAIDEAIELAKEFGEEVNGKFVNGVLGAIYKNYKKEKNE
jgi:N utilization substance protein B